MKYHATQWVNGDEIVKASFETAVDAMFYAMKFEANCVNGPTGILALMDRDGTWKITREGFREIENHRKEWEPYER